MSRNPARNPQGVATPAHEDVRVLYKTKTIGGVEVFYREAGPKTAPAVLLLHGFPTSSHMFRTLIPALADRYHVIAPDLPGFGFTTVRCRSPLRVHFRKSGGHDRALYRNAWPRQLRHLRF